MSAEIVDNAEGVLTIKISGKLRQSELTAAQKNAAKILEKRGGSRVLVMAEKFEGWKRGMTGESFRGRRNSMRKSIVWQLSAKNDGKTWRCSLRAKASATLISSTFRQRNCPGREVGSQAHAKAAIDLWASTTSTNESLREDPDSWLTSIP